ncbi:MAG: hypothetical protein COV38_16100 [Bdellovibrionales bacterium CG11_big_fil_rev_8_21_14_0_20_38_13]|nr:MAG: hypothetical protein COV38_16100 [Bdellovibrionales bacterium CG11_big_fil_rev_8_21_14_0_20_38_13]
MIYELSLVAKTELSDEQIEKLNTLVRDVVGQHDGEVFIQDDWGKMNLAQPTENGTSTGHFMYFLFKANNANNKELARRFGINEGVLRHMIIKVGEEKDIGNLVKNYKTPFSKKYNGSVTDTDEEEGGVEADKRFARRRSCFFTVNQIKADWKDPKTYAWLVNEFGKISPARVSNISRKHQRFATTAVKRARQMALISHLSNRIADKL